MAKKKKKSKNKLIFDVILVLTLTIATLFFSFYSAGGGDVKKGIAFIGNALYSTNKLWIAVVLTLVVLSYLLDGLIIYVFCRLYTRNYHYGQGIANSSIGAFYNNVTPGATGGQFMQALTLKSQGIEISNAASIMVMWFIIYEFAMISFDVLAIIFQWKTIMSIQSITIEGIQIGDWHGEIPMLPLIVLGLLYNLVYVAILLLMSYSRPIHNFVLNIIVKVGTKFKLIKNPNKTREIVRSSLENFKSELRRLQKNIPVTILTFILMMGVFLLRYSIPYFAGLSLDAFGSSYAGFNFNDMFSCCFRSAFSQMVAGLIPLPGGAGVSELAFTAMFNDIFLKDTGNIMAAQIIWRAATYHIVIVISGIVSMTYHARPKEDVPYGTFQTFVNLNLSTLDESTMNETLFDTRMLSKKDVRGYIADDTVPLFGVETGDDYVGSLPGGINLSELIEGIDEIE